MYLFYYLHSVQDEDSRSLQRKKYKIQLNSTGNFHFSQDRGTFLAQTLA